MVESWQIELHAANDEVIGDQNSAEQGSDLVIAFQNGDNLYLVGTSLATFNAQTDLRL